MADAQDMRPTLPLTRPYFKGRGGGRSLAAALLFMDVEHVCPLERKIFHRNGPIMSLPIVTARLYVFFMAWSSGGIITHTETHTPCRLPQ